MKKSLKFFIISVFLIIISTPLAYKSVSVLYYNKNLTGEYVSILEGFINSYILVGIFIFIIGLVNYKNDIEKSN